jgi:hypothetical protein
MTEEIYSVPIRHCNKCKQDKFTYQFTPKATYCQDCVREYKRRYNLLSKGKSDVNAGTKYVKYNLLKIERRRVYGRGTARTRNTFGYKNP